MQLKIMMMTIRSEIGGPRISDSKGSLIPPARDILLPSRNPQAYTTTTL